MSKCPYYGSCNKYDPQGVTCNQDGGVYHADGHLSSCVREAIEREKARGGKVDAAH